MKSPELCQFMPKPYQIMRKNFFFVPNLKSLSLKMPAKHSFCELDILLCHMKGSAPTDPKN